MCISLYYNNENLRAKIYVIDTKIKQVMHKSVNHLILIVFKKKANFH